jgi:hypothetical protein
MLLSLSVWNEKFCTVHLRYQYHVHGFYCISSTKGGSTVLVMPEKVFHFSCLWIYRLRISGGPKKHLSCLFNLMMTRQIFCIRQLSFLFFAFAKDKYKAGCTVYIFIHFKMQLRIIFNFFVVFFVLETSLQTFWYKTYSL